MQVFRLMGMPDRVIAFDELPKQYLEGLDMCDCSKLGRAWRDFIGPVDKVTPVKPEMDTLTRQMRYFPPIEEKAPFAYLIDWEINHDKDRWAEIVEYVRRNAPVSWEQDMTAGKQTVRMMDDLEKMAKPLARDAHSELDLEPEDVFVIPLVKLAVPKLADPAPVIQAEAPKAEFTTGFQCPDCQKPFTTKQAMRLHKMRKHKVAVTA